MSKPDTHATILIGMVIRDRCRRPDHCCRYAVLHNQVEGSRIRFPRDEHHALSYNQSQYPHTNLRCSRKLTILQVSVETGVLCAVFAILDLSIFVRTFPCSSHLSFIDLERPSGQVRRKQLPSRGLYLAVKGLLKQHHGGE